MDEEDTFMVINIWSSQSPLHGRGKGEALSSHYLTYAVHIEREGEAQGLVERVALRR